MFFFLSAHEGLGVYCNGVKCSPGDKCELDRKTNKNVCRAGWRGWSKTHQQNE